MTCSSTGSVEVFEDEDVYSFDLADVPVEVDEEWADTSGLSEDARHWVNVMIRKMPAKLKDHLTNYHRKKVYSRILGVLASQICEDELRIEPLTSDQIVHLLAVGTTQIYKTLLPSAGSLTGRWLHTLVGVVSKTVDNQVDLSGKLADTYLTGQKVKTVSASKRGHQEVLDNWETTTFVMAATKPQLATFLSAVAILQEHGIVKTWMLVLDECDALKTSEDDVHLYEQALRTLMGDAEFQVDGVDFTIDGEAGSVPARSVSIRPPSVVLHETATPQPTMLRFQRSGVDIKPQHFFKLDIFPNYVGKKNYRFLCDELGDDITLLDGELSACNAWVDNRKARAWIEDLAATPNGVGVYLANSRVNTDNNNLDTAWKLRSLAKTSHPSVTMAVGAYSATMLRWYPPSATSKDGFEVVRVGRGVTKEGEVKLSHSKALSLMEEAAGQASVCVVSYTTRRSVSWRTATRVQSSFANALPKTWDMPNYGQANGRATGDNMATLVAATGRDYVSYLGHLGCHLADLSTEFWVDEVCRRVAGGLTLLQAMDGQAQPFPPKANFDIARSSRPPPKATRKTVDRRLVYEWKDKEALRQATGSDTGYCLHLSGPDSRVALCLPTDPTAPTEDGVVVLRSLPLAEAVMITDAQLIGEARGVASEGEPALPVVVTRLEVLSLEDLGLDFSLAEAEADMRRRGATSISTALQQRLGGASRLCYVHNVTRLGRDVRSQQQQDKTSGYWRLTVNEADQPVVALVRYSPWESMQQLTSDRIVWHSFHGIPHQERKDKEGQPGSGTVSIVSPTVVIKTRGPVEPTADEGRLHKRQRQVTLGDMIAVGLIEPGEEIMTTTYHESTISGDLLPSGHIRFSDHLFSSPTQFRKAAMLHIDPQAPVSTCGSGWSCVLWNGTKLDRLRQDL